MQCEPAKKGDCKLDMVVWDDVPRKPKPNEQWPLLIAGELKSTYYWNGGRNHRKADIDRLRRILADEQFWGEKGHRYAFVLQAVRKRPRKHDPETMRADLWENGWTWYYDDLDEELNDIETQHLRVYEVIPKQREWVR